MQKNKSLIKNEYIHSVCTKFFAVLIGVLQSVVVARYLGAALQGTATYISSIASMGATIITFGIHQVYPYFRKKYGKDAVYQDFLSVVVIIYISYLFLAVCLSIFCFESNELRIAIILMPIYGYSNVVSYILLIENPNKRNDWWIIISLIDILFIFLLMLVSNGSLVSAAMILMFAELLKGFSYSSMLHIKFRFHKGLIELAANLFKMGFLPMLALLMTTLNYKVDILMLRSFDNISATQIGVYSIGMMYADKIALIPDTLKGVLASKLSKGADVHEVAKVSRFCFVISAFFCMFFVLLGETIINWLYGKEYEGAYQVLMICSVGTIFIGYFKLIAQYNIINKKQIRNILLLSVSILINVLLNCILIPRFELAGAAFASGVGYFLSGIIFVIWFSKSNNLLIREMFFLQKSDLNLPKRK